MALFDAPTGAETPSLNVGAPGSQGYQDAIMGQVQRRLKPAYQSALKSSMQGMSDRGMLGGGQDQAARLGLQENFLNQLGDASTNTALQGSQLGEQQREFEANRTDRASQLQFMKEQAQAERDAQARNQWTNMAGQGGMAALSLLPELLL